MSQARLSNSSPSALPVAARGASPSSVLPGSRMTQSRIIGALFLLGFMSYGIGSGLVTSLVGGSNFLATIASHQTLVVIGVVLILLNTAVDVGKGVLFFPILEKHSKRTALTYLSTMIVEVVLLAVGALAFLMLVPLSNLHGADAAVAQVLATLAVHANAMAYNTGEAVLAVGAIFFCLLLYRTRLIPRWLTISALIGYPCLLAGSIAELFGVHVGLMLTVPGMFFEIVLPFWLFTKGFQAQAYRGPTITESAA
jgi:hypothetical protein